VIAENILHAHNVLTAVRADALVVSGRSAASARNASVKNLYQIIVDLSLALCWNRHGGNGCKLSNQQEHTGARMAAYHLFPCLYYATHPTPRFAMKAACKTMWRSAHLSAFH